MTLSDLQEWARKNGNTPEFLLPEFNPKRATLLLSDIAKFSKENANNKSVKKQSILERDKMLAAILGMAIDAYGYDPQEKRVSGAVEPTRHRAAIRRVTPNAECMAEKNSSSCPK